MGANDLVNAAAAKEGVTLAVPAAVHGDGVGCHSGKEAMLEAAKTAGKSEVLAQYAKDYPLPEGAGPHDQPQSMCPAFGSLRVGLRMRRTATILSGSACCVYGLTFTSHFYGARRSVGYVPFNSESLVTGKLFEDIREAVLRTGRPGVVRQHRHHQPLRAHGQRCAAAAAAQADQRRTHHRHRRTRFRRAHARRGQGRAGRRHAEVMPAPEAEAGPVTAPRNGISSKPTVTLLGEMFPADPMIIGAMLEPMGLACGPVRAHARMARTVCRARLRRSGRHPPLLHRQRARIRDRRPLRRCPRRRWATTAPKPGCRRSARPATSRQAQIDAAKNRFLPAIKRRAGQDPDQGPHHGQRLRRQRTAGGAAADRKRR